MRRWMFALLLASGLLAGLAPAVAAPAGRVEVIPISGPIDDGMAHLVSRAVREARGRHARAIVIVVDTFGGLVSSGTEIRDALLASDIPVDAFVAGRAWSAGALVTLAARRIAMAPGSSIGAAEPIPATAKTVSALRAEFESTAERFGRDPRIAGAMVDVNRDLPRLKAPGAILTLTAADAVRAHFADTVAPSLPAALGAFGVAGARVDDAHYTVAERLARFATNPQISSILLALGFLGLLIEMQTLHGIAGTIGVGALALFFGTHVYAGFADEFVIALAAAGVLGILFELHVLPGHGVAGGLGIAALAAAIVLAFGFSFVFVAVQSLAVAIVLTAFAFALAARVHPENAFVARLAFAGVQGAEYVAGGDYRDLLGRAGTAASYLRPAGVATIDGRRIDVLTEGEFVNAGTPVRVTRVEGSRIFVQPA